MRNSLRAKRLARNHKRNSQQPKLNLVSLMDIFTILVFFLMVNSGDVEVLSSDKDISLPNSIAEQKPELALILKVSDLDMVLQGRKLGPTYEIDKSVSELTLEQLGRELQYQSARRTELTEKEQTLGLSVTIMGDREIHYRLLKKIMLVCAENNYRNISLAVNHVAAISVNDNAATASRGG